MRNQYVQPIVQKHGSRLIKRRHARARAQERTAGGTYDLPRCRKSRLARNFGSRRLTAISRRERKGEEGRGINHHDRRLTIDRCVIAIRSTTVSALPANHRLNDLSRSIGRQQKRPRDIIFVPDKSAIRIARSITIYRSVL